MAAFHAPEAPAAPAALALPSDRDERGPRGRTLVWAMGATGSSWPIPNKGLAWWLHRVTAPALSSGGRRSARSRRPVPGFAARLADARVEIVPGAGHVPQLERLDVVAPLVLDFLAS